MSDQRAELSQSWYVALLVVAVAGGVVAVVIPETWARFFRSRVVGIDDPVIITQPRMVLACIGVSLAMLTLIVLSRIAPRRPGQPRRLGLRLAAVPFVWACAFNMHPLLREQHLVIEGGKLPYSTLGQAAFGLVALVILMPYLWREARDLRVWPALGTGILAGAAYGSFSALWHCCPAASTWGSPWVVVAGVSVLVCASIILLGFVAAVATRYGLGWGELFGGVLFLAFYRYHTDLWLLHCLAGGAFLVWLSRRTGSLLAPGVAASTAYIVHMTLPFMGWRGPGIALVLLVALGALLLRPAETLSEPSTPRSPA